MSSPVGAIRHSTLFEYAITEEFISAGIDCTEELSEKEIALLIEQADKDLAEGKKISQIHLKIETEFPEDAIKQAQIMTAELTLGTSQRTDELLRTYSGKGLVLDLGCGIGKNCEAFLLKGWNAYALDKHKQGLDTFETRIKTLQKEKQDLGKYRIIHKDITLMGKLATNLDLVLADEVLPYISPTSLVDTIKKIYDAILPGGLFMGTLFTHIEPKTAEDRIKLGFSCLVNCHSYRNPALMANILRLAGFQIESCRVSPIIFNSGQPSPISSSVEFIARKGLPDCR